MTKEQKQLINEAAEAFAKMLQHPDLYQTWGDIWEETKGAMREYEAEQEQYSREVRLTEHAARTY